MKQIVGILLLLFTLQQAAISQSRILSGTIASKPNSSITITPNIVLSKTPEAQIEDSAIFNPRYIPPPPIDSSSFNSNSYSANSSGLNTNQSGVAEDYQYKAPNSQPLIDGNKKASLTPPINYRNKKTNTTTYSPPPPVLNNITSSNEDTYQYKTEDAKPLVDYGAKKVVRYPVRKRKVSVANQYASTLQTEASNQSSVVTDPAELAANENYGNAPVKKTYNKWTPKKKTWTKPIVDSNATVAIKKPVYRWVNPNKKKVAASSYYVPPTQTQTTYTPPVVVSPSQGGLTPTIKVKTRPSNNPVVNNTSTTTSQSQQTTVNTTYGPSADYKINLTQDGKFTVNFFNSGSSINVTEFGRISGVTSPISSNTTSQYDYRGMLQSVGTLPLQYTYEGRLQSVGNTSLGYNYNGNIESIGGMPLSYNYNGTIDKIGNTKVMYDANNNVSGTSNNNPMVMLKVN